MKKSIICAALLIFISCLAATRSNAQQVYLFSQSSCEHDGVDCESSVELYGGIIWGYSSTEVDYWTSDDYSAYVDGELYDQNNTLLDAGWDEEDFIAQVYTSTPANPGTIYIERGYHDVIARYYYEDIDKGPEGCSPCDGCNTDCYYFYDNWYWADPFGFSFMNGGYFGDWENLYGFGPPAEIENDETVRLGETSRSLQTPTAKVDIQLNGSSVTGRTVSVIVGQKMNLTTSVQPSNGTVTNSQWTVPGGDSDRIANYVVVPPPQGGYSPTSATVTNLTTFTNSSVDFYWISGGSRTVQYSCKVNNNAVQAQVTFNVQRPTAQISITTSSTNIGVDSQSGATELRLGNPDTTPGLTFTRTVSIPSGFNGSTHWVQVFTKKSASRTDYNAQVFNQNRSGLDDFYPYPPDPGATSANLKTSDTPALFLDGFVAGSVDFEATMWLLFRPTVGTNPIWVPLRQVSWVWTANANYDGSTWTITSPNDPTNLSDSDSTSHPQWTTNAH